MDAGQLSKETRKDPELSKVIQYLQQGWPSKVTPALRPYYSRQSELTMGNKSCDSHGMPKESSSRVATSHPGIVKMKLDCSNTCLVATGE